MKEVIGIKLPELFIEATDVVIEEKRKSIRNLIKQLFYRQIGLAEDVVSARKSLAKKEQELEKTNEKLAKIKTGDWSVLVDTGDTRLPDGTTR